MATYFTNDFADFPADWTEQYNTAGTFSVTGGDLTLPSANPSDWRGLSWNDIDSDANRANVELLIKLTTGGASGATYFAFVRGSGADESATLYSVFISASALRIYYCSGSDTPVQAATVAKTPATSTTYWVRFRVNGSGPTTIQARLWADGGGEPGTWDIDTTDSSGPTAAGWCGFSVYNNVGFSPTILQVGVGTNGDTAPSSAGAAASSVPVRAFPRPIMMF